jgi:hypothetical protein
VRKIPIGAVHGFQTGAVDGQEFPAEEIEFATQQHELAEDGLECASIILAKIGDGFEVRRQPPRQPKDVSAVFRIR